MDFTLPEELLLFKKSLRRFIQNELDPLIEEVEEADWIPENVIKKMADMGLFGVTIPQEYEGMELGILGYMVTMEEMGRTSWCFHAPLGNNNNLGSKAIIHDGTEEQRRKYLPPFAKGEIISAFALTEPNAGSDVAAIETFAKRDGNNFILNGSKIHVSNGPISQVFLVVALTDRKLRARGGITLFIVEKGTPGFTIGKQERKMGGRGHLDCGLAFEDCVVPSENVVGDVGQGYIRLMKMLGEGRIGTGAVALGQADKALEMALDYAKVRVQFGKPIAYHQLIQGMLAEMATGIHASRMMLYNAAWKADQGMDVTREASMAKLFVAETACRVADKALQIHGGMGYMKEYHIERLYRDVRLARIVEGTSEIQKIIIAGDLIKKGLDL